MIRYSMRWWYVRQRYLRRFGLWLRHHLSKQRRRWKQGHVCVGLGVLVIAAAQFWTALPVVTSIALIGRGAILTLQSGRRTNRQEALIVVNTAVYGTLVCLAIVAQSNAMLQASMADVSLVMLLDHAAAIVVTAGLIVGVYSRLSQPTT